MGDQAVEVIGQIGQCQFRLSPLDSDGADEQPEPVFLMREHMLDPGTDRGLAAFARAVAFGMDFPLGLRRWMRLDSMRSASHISFVLERYAVSAQTSPLLFSAITRRNMRPSA